MRGCGALAFGNCPSPFHSWLMADFIHVVFSKGRPEAVERVHTLLGDVRFQKTYWFVAHGQRSAYQDAGAAAHLVQETGDLCQTVQCAINMTNKKKKPLTFMSDDVRGFFCKQGDPKSWPNWRGRQLAFGSFTSQILKAMRQVGVPMGAVYHMACARTQLRMPIFSYHHFCNLDFLVMDPPFPLQLHHDARVNVKVDYHLSASVLAAFGATCRVNRLSIDAPHYQQGGAGDKKKREKGDAAAAKWLMMHWGSGPSKQNDGSSEVAVFRENKKRTGNRQVLMRGEPLIRKCDSRLEQLHKTLYEAVSSTKMTYDQIKDSLERRPRQQGPKAKAKKKTSKLAIGSRLKAQANKKWRTYKRSERGTKTQGPGRRAGRLAFGRVKASMKERQALSRARQALRKVVLELRRKCQEQHRQA